MKYQMRQDEKIGGKRRENIDEKLSEDGKVVL